MKSDRRQDPLDRAGGVDGRDGPASVAIRDLELPELLADGEAKCRAHPRPVTSARELKHLIRVTLGIDRIGHGVEQFEKPRSAFIRESVARGAVTQRDVLGYGRRDP